MQRSLKDVLADIQLSRDTTPGVVTAPAIFVTAGGEEYDIGDVVWDEDNGYWAFCEDDDPEDDE